jgi:hypothetical protein
VDIAWLKSVWPTASEEWVERFWSIPSDTSLFGKPGKRSIWINAIAKAPGSDKQTIRELLDEQLHFTVLYSNPPAGRLRRQDWKPEVFVALNELLKSFYDPLFYKPEGFPNVDGTHFNKDQFIGLPPRICPYSDDLIQDVKLDHFLPKDQFPVLSLHPDNLIPCGTDANSGGHKGTSVPLDLDENDQAGNWFHPRLRSAKDKFDVSFCFKSGEAAATLIPRYQADAQAIQNLDRLFDLSDFWSRHLNPEIQLLAGLISGDLRDEGIVATEIEVRTRLVRLSRQKDRSKGKEPLAIVHSHLYQHVLNTPDLFCQVLRTCLQDTEEFQ